MNRPQRLAGNLPFALVVVSLLASVAVPARQTWSITALLRETTDVLEPARLLGAQLRSGVAEELGALQSYAISGNAQLLDRYESTAVQNDERMTKLSLLASQLHPVSERKVEVIRDHLQSWRHLTDSLVRTLDSSEGFAAALPATRARYDVAVSSIEDLSRDLAAETSARDGEVRALDHFGLVSNATLVFVALAGLLGVTILTVRERRALADAQRRARQEVSLREAAEALAGAFTVDEVTQRIAQAALETMEARGAFVEELSPAAGDEEDSVVVRAISGHGVPSLACTCGFAGSHTQQAIAAGEPMLIDDLKGLECLGTVSGKHSLSGAAIVVPLGDSRASTRALFILSHARVSFRDDDVARAGIFGHLATFAYEKVRLLDEAHEGRHKLQRVLQSRSRLMRGFSHDVKNPIGAADGYAELLAEGIYGELSSEQKESVMRIRRCIRGALSLIDDLHELARVESGHLVVNRSPVDLAKLMYTIGEEYQAAARAAGLSLSIEADKSLPLVETSESRVSQIASNLLSNAIKYTRSGTVTVRVLRRRVGRSGDKEDWAAVEFIDTGPGIPSDKQETIFEEFSRLDTISKPGAGLGLAVSRLLAEALGGQITVESNMGRGSTFTLWLPIGTTGKENEGPASAITTTRPDSEKEEPVMVLPI